MDQQQLLLMLRGLQPEEMHTLMELMRDMTEAQKQQFIMLYQGKRKEEQNMMILTLVGFLGFAGLQRFVIGDTVLGILFLITLGFCGIGTIIDLVNLKNLTTDYNTRQAIEAANMVRVMYR